jgi:hypothetical protein
MNFILNLRITHVRNNRVPHLRDGLIVAKVGGAAITLWRAR